MKQYLFIMLFLLTGFSVRAQYTITGRVLSAEDRQPLPGAVIKIGSSNITTSADDAGNFRLQCSSDTCTLEVSFMAYTSKRVRASAKGSALIVFLEPAQMLLPEVLVSTGYQQLPKERITGSFTHIDNKTFNQQVSTDILSRLEAVANGLTVDRGTNRSGRISIRGISSIQGPKDVLVVLDNFPYEGELDNINPNDIEDITILKDAAAASIWGARAGNGVIVITTKKGKFNQPLGVEFNTNFTIGDKPDLSYISQMSSSDFIDVEKLLYSKNYFNSQINSANKPVLSPVVELLIKRSAASPAGALAIDSEIDALRSADVRNDFAKYLYQSSMKQQYALNLRGGSDKIAWTASGAHDLNSDDLDAGFSRVNLRFQNIFRPFKKLELSSGIYYTQTESTSGRPGYGEAAARNQYLFPYARFADEVGNSLAIPKNWRQSFVQTVGDGKLLDWNYYPLEDFKHSTSKTSVNDILLNTGIRYSILEGLAADLKYTYERQNSGTRSLNDAESYFARDMINSYTQLSPSGISYKIPKGGILDQTAGVVQSSNLRMQLNYNRTWKKHQLAAIGGSELRRANDRSNRSRYYGYNDANLTHGLVDLSTKFPNIITGSNNLITDNNDLSESGSNFISYFGNAAYTYLGRYSLSLSGRRDASNLFGLKTNDQWNPFWSAGASWALSDEKFYSSGILPYLRLRGSYGFSGNINASMVAATTIGYAGTSPYTSSPFARFTHYYNSELRWEKSGTANAGIDFSSKANIISGSIEYYFKKGKDLFGPAILDYTGGVGPSITKNVAGMKGHGFDIELRSRNFDKTFKWQTNLNFSTFKDEIMDYYKSTERGSDFINTYSNIRISGLEGKPVYAIYSYKWAGLDPLTGEPRGYLDNNLSTDYSSLTGAATGLEDLKYHGSAMPAVFGSLGNTFSWKNISMNFAFTYKFGYYFRRESINYSNLFINWQSHSDFGKRWQQPGDETSTNVPALAYPTTTAKNNFYAGSEVLVEKGDHIRLQYINLSYELNRTALLKLPVRNLVVFANISNLGLIWKASKEARDPDYNYGSYRVLPSKMYAIGIRTNLN